MTTCAVIFDFFGTLVDEHDRLHDPMLQAVARILRIPYERFLPAFEATGRERGLGLFRDTAENLVAVCRNVDVQPSSAVLQQAVSAFRDGFRQQLEDLRPDTLETLQALKKRGLPRGLVSNINLEGPRLWPDCPLAPYFDAATPACTGATGPIPDPFSGTANDAF